MSVSLGRRDVETFPKGDGPIEIPNDQRSNPWEVARKDRSLEMGLTGRFIHVGLVEINEIGSGVILNDVEAECTSLVAKARARMFPNEVDELVHMLWLDGDVRQDAVHCSLPSQVESIPGPRRVKSGRAFQQVRRVATEARLL